MVLPRPSAHPALPFSTRCGTTAAEIAEPEIVEEEEAVPHLANIYPKFGAAMPMLKEMLLSSRA